MPDVVPGPMRTIEWVDGAVVIVDQTALPHELRRVTLHTVDEMIDAIARLAVRGAPALGVAGALGVALAARSASEAGQVAAEAERLRSARPTAVNLARGVDRALARLGDGPDAVLAAALAVLDAEVEASRAMARRGADEIGLLRGGAPLRLLTHCNTGALACVEGGTALGVVAELHRRHLVAEVLATETRPLLQGARLTAWELRQLGVPHRVCVDSAGPSAIGRGLVDAVVVGADRVAANGDVANKVGTFPLALAAARAGVPFYVVAPESTLDAATADGRAIEVEERDAGEVTSIGGTPLAPAGTDAWNPAFDVTPADLVTAVITDQRVWRAGTLT
jgi:methylthioribose-1-phosphate isomerase